VSIFTSFHYNNIATVEKTWSSGTLKSRIFFFPLDIIKNVLLSKEHTCSQNVLITCYFHDSMGEGSRKDYPTSVVEACNNRQVLQLSTI